MCGSAPLPTIVFTCKVSPAICSTKYFVGSIVVVTVGLANATQLAAKSVKISFFIKFLSKKIAEVYQKQLSCNLI